MTVSSLDGDDRAMVRAIAYGRVGLGTTFLVAPRLAMRLWPGPIAGATPTSDAVASLLARSVGGRDLALALGTLLALHHETPLQGWLEAGVLADATDAVAIVLALGHLPKGRALAMLGCAVGAAVVGHRLASRP